MLLKIIVSLVFCCCCWSYSSVSAAEITDQELTQLEINLTKLKTLNQKSRVELRTLKDQLKLSNDQLAALNEQLNQLATQSTKQEESLKIANESFEKYEKEMKAKLHHAETQRNFILALLAILLIRN